jgi:hypothetical protein
MSVLGDLLPLSKPLPLRELFLEVG